MSGLKPINGFFGTAHIDTMAFPIDRILGVALRVLLVGTQDAIVIGI